MPDRSVAPIAQQPPHGTRLMVVVDHEAIGAKAADRAAAALLLEQLPVALVGEPVGVKAMAR